MSIPSDQLALIGRHIDRLVTVEARISPTSRNVIAHLYEAACAAQGGGPLSMRAAEQILAHLGPGKTVFLTTGAGSTGRHILQVDGMPADVSCAIVTMLGCIVRNG